MKKFDTRKLSIIALLCGMAYALVAFIRIPVVLFLSYEPKDIIITIGGFLFGPLTVLCISLIVSLTEMLTISGTGVWGFIMNVLATCAFACPAAIIYKRKSTFTGAVLGLLTGFVIMVPVMLLWNYLIVPLYMPGVTRADMVPMLISMFLPFNLIKGGLNVAFILLLYKPITAALRKSGIIY